MTDPVLSTVSAEELAALLSQLGGVLLSAQTVDSTVQLVTGWPVRRSPGLSAPG